VKDQLLNDTGEELDEDGRVLRDKTWVAFKLEKINSYGESMKAASWERGPQLENHNGRQPVTCTVV
jgi:hypothetical protein